MDKREEMFGQKCLVRFLQGINIIQYRNPSEEEAIPTETEEMESLAYTTLMGTSRTHLLNLSFSSALWVCGRSEGQEEPPWRIK